MTTNKTLKIKEIQKIGEYQTDEENFSIVYMNCRSIRNKMDEIELLLSESKADILVVTETWIDENEEDNFCITGFKTVYCSQKKRGGGVGTFLKSGIKFELLEKVNNEISK